MNNIEEKLWNYIDGSCLPDEQQAISLLIEQDELYRSKYLELLQLNQEFNAIELEEPPMAFTYNVMEAIRAEHAQKPLKASINLGIIGGISAFFIFVILALVIIALASIQWSSINPGLPVTNFQLPNFSKYFSGPVIKGFLYFDVILGLFLFDAYLRKKSFSKQS
ncbi:MAG TPA: hypothetical protein VGC01_10590 [Mucilaginibacter sp.]